MAMAPASWRQRLLPLCGGGAEDGADALGIDALDERGPDEGRGAGVRELREDDGVGVAADEKEKIFDRGFGKNTGLGLFLAREILSITGITICETGQPGKGARFEMTVPKGMWRAVDVDSKVNLQ